MSGASADVQGIFARLALGAVAAVLTAAMLGCTVRHELELVPDDNGWPASAEFSHLVTGQTRFSSHGAGVDGILVLVDHQTGVQYLVTLAGTCPLLDADGAPLLVAEAGE